MNSRPTPLLAVALLLLASTAAFSQYKYAVTKLKTKTGNDETAYILNTDNLGQILLSGYLDGKIKGYSFSVGDTVAKWKPSETLPDAWDGATYYEGDIVSFDKKVYRSLVNDNTQKPGDEKYWKVTELKDPLSRTLFFPSLRDTLPKKDFLERMVERWPEVYIRWNRSNEYFMGDRVQYNDRSYEAQEDVRTGRDPESDRASWQEISNDMYFARWDACNYINILVNKKLNGSDTLLVPQMLSVRRFDENIGFPKAICDFYFSDVVAYLKTVSQPVTTVFKYGYVNNGVFELSSQTRSEGIDWIKTKIKSKSLKPSKVNIKDQKLYAEWLADTTSAQDWSSQWTIYQQSVSRELILSKKADDITPLTQFLSIPQKMLSALIKKEKLPAYEINNITSLLTDRANLVLDEYLFDPHYDSLVPQPYKAVDVVSPTKQEYLWLEQHRMVLNIAGNEEMAGTIPKAWTELEKAYFSGKLKDVTNTARYTFFPDHYDWSKISLSNGPGYSKTFSLSGDRDKGVSFLQLAKSFISVGVTYQKNFRLDKSISPTDLIPVEFSIYYNAPGDVDTPYYASRVVSFKWEDVKQILTSMHDDQLNALITAVENGSLNYSESDLIYGLKEK